MDLVELFADVRFFDQAVMQNLRVAVDNREEVVEIVGDAAGQSAYRVQSLRMHQGFPQLPIGCHVLVSDHDLREVARVVDQCAERPGDEQRRIVFALEITLLSEGGRRRRPV